MRVIIQKDLFERSKEVFTDAHDKFGIEFNIVDVLDEKSMLELHKKDLNCFVIGAEAYSESFYRSLNADSLVIRYGVGYNAVPIDICKERNIKVAYTPGTLTDSVAEHTFAMLLAMGRNIPQLDASMKSNSWQGVSGTELKGKTIAILGFGQIGKAVARIAKFGFGMKINAFDVMPSIECDFVDYYSNDFKSVVENADIVSIHIAVVPATKGFINAERIALFRNGVQFINISRGDLVDERALFNALKSHKISKAAIDVFINEPYTPTNDADFRLLDNVVLTPHCGSNTFEASSRMAKMVVENILAYYNDGQLTLIPELNS